MKRRTGTERRTRRPRKPTRPKRKIALALLVMAVLTAGFPAQSFAAAGDPVLRFGLETADAVTGIQKGSTIAVTVDMSRQDGEAAYDLYAVQLDLIYDSSLFEVSQLKNADAQRPDGQNWIGSWSCNSIPGTGDNGQIRVLYTNIGGLMSKPPKLDSVSAPVQAAAFTLTAKKDMPGAESKVTLAYTEITGSDWKIGQSVKGDDITLSFAGSGGESNGGNSSGGSDASGGGTNGGGSNGSGHTGGSGGSGSGSDGGSGSSGSGTGGNTDASGSGTSGGTDGGSGGSGSGQSGSAGNPSVRFSELTDVPADHWAADHIRYLVERGIVSGNEEKQFQPETPVTRAEFCQMLCSAFGCEPQGGQSVFSDVTAADWYFKPVMALYEAGIAAGAGDGRFGAEDTLSRQDMAQLVYRVLTDQGITLAPVREYEGFRDAAQLESYAAQAVRQLYCAGIISGTGDAEFSPGVQSTRAQAATVLTKLLQEIEERR